MGIVPRGRGQAGDDDPVVRDGGRLPLPHARTASGAARCSASGWRTGLSVYPGVDSITLTTVGDDVSPVTGTLDPARDAARGHRRLQHRDVRVRQRVSVRLARRGAGAGGAAARRDGARGARRRIAGWRTTSARALAKKLGYPYRTEDWQAQNNSLFQALRLEKLGMTLILMLIILVAAFNIVGTLTMVVADKTKEIGILRAMGMTASSIRRIFLAQGIMIGVVGTALGLAARARDGDRARHVQADPAESRGVLHRSPAGRAAAAGHRRHRGGEPAHRGGRPRSIRRCRRRACCPVEAMRE